MQTPHSHFKSQDLHFLELLSHCCPSSWVPPLPHNASVFHGNKHNTTIVTNKISFIMIVYDNLKLGLDTFLLEFFCQLSTCHEKIYLCRKMNCNQPLYKAFLPHFTASILEFPSKEIHGKSWHKSSYPMYLSLHFLAKEINWRFPCIGKAAGLEVCCFSRDRKSNNSGSVCWISMPLTWDKLTDLYSTLL